jgi:hypothetical protein
MAGTQHALSYGEDLLVQRDGFLGTARCPVGVGQIGPRP